MTRLQIFVVLGVIALLVALLLIPFGQVAVYDGHFDLTVKLSTPVPDEHGVSIAYCWNEAEAEHAMMEGVRGEVPFHFGDASNQGQRIIAVPFSGHINSFGYEKSYHEPKFMVVEIATTDAQSAPYRKKFSMPKGNGHRTIEVRVP